MQTAILAMFIVVLIVAISVKLGMLRNQRPCTILLVASAVVMFIPPLQYLDIGFLHG